MPHAPADVRSFLTRGLENEEGKCGGSPCLARGEHVATWK